MRTICALQKKTINNLLNGGMSNNIKCPIAKKKKKNLHQNDLEFENTTFFDLSTILIFAAIKYG